jgi:hypothetical protein
VADASTTLYGLVKPEVGASSDTWGGKWNTNADDTDTLLGAITTTGSANAYVLTTGLSLAAYVNGQSFLIRASFANTGGATLNVDAIGAKNLRKNVAGTLTALASGDIFTGDYLRVTYNSASDVFVVAGVGQFQALDATLTALEALSWSSGSPLVQFTAADTVSLTLTPSVSSVTASQGAAATTPSGTFVNTNDAASVRVLRLEGDRATPGANDNIYGSFFLSNVAGTQIEFARIKAFVAAAAAGNEGGFLYFATSGSGALADRLVLTSSILAPATNDGLALGSTALMWADGFWASGATHNFNNGNVVLTHNNTQAVVEATTGKLVSGLKASTETTGTLAVASRNRVVNCSGDVTLDDGVFAKDDWLIFDPGTSARTFTRASGLTMYVNGVDSASATLAANQMGSAYWRSATVVVLAGAFT